MRIIRSPLAYQGSKFKLIHAIEEQSGKFIRFHDVFGGSGVVSLNMCLLGETYYNDWDPAAYSVLKHLKAAPNADKIISRLNKTIVKHGLSRINESNYYKFREHYNKNPNPFDLWVLSKHSFSSLMRFSRNGFNLPFGRRGIEPSESRDKWIRDFWNRLQFVQLHNESYLQYVKRTYMDANKDDLFYFDPPYLASGANVYKGDWTIKDEKKLLSLLDFLDNRGIRWILSNVIQHREFTNKILKKWMKQYTVVYPNFRTKGEGYTLNRAATSGPNNTIEVLVKNF